MSSSSSSLLVQAMGNVACTGTDEELQSAIAGKIRAIPDFPKPGIVFRDVTTLLASGTGLRTTIELFLRKLQSFEFDVVVGIEARGLILGSCISLCRGCGFVPARKAGKLPAATFRVEYALEYGKDSLEIHRDAICAGQKVLIVDDLLATGGTMTAACTLVELCGGSVVACTCIVELPELRGRQVLRNRNLVTLVSFEGH